MAVNQDIYGLRSQWIDTKYSVDGYRNKKAYFASGKSQLNQGVTAGKLSYTLPIDKSISYCGLGKESGLSNIAYIGTSEGALSILEYQEREVTNFAFFEQTNTANPIYSDRIYTTQLNRNCWAPSPNTSFNSTPYLEPWTVVNPKSLVLSIFVKAYNSTNTSTTTRSLYDYIQTYKTSYPNIHTVYVTPYYQETNDYRTTNAMQGTPEGGQSPFILGTLDEYSCTIDPINFYFYANRKKAVLGNVICSDNMLTGDYLYMFNYTAACKSHIRIINDRAIIEYFDGVEEEILKTVACFGLYFTPDTNTAATGSHTSSLMYIGLLDSQGVGHGDYFKGADTVRAPQNNWTDMSNSKYDPSAQYIDYDRQTHYGTANYADINKLYSLTEVQVLQVMSQLSNAMAALPANMSEVDYSTGTFLTSDPIDCIISLRKYPIADTSINSESTYPLKFGAYVSNISAPYAKRVGIYQYNFTGSKAFISNYGNSFLDREGYTTAELFIPFCGTVKLDVNEYINHDIGVRLVVDFRTGVCTAYVELDGKPRQTISGDIGIDVPLTGVQINDLTNTILRNQANLKQAQISVVQAASGGATMSSGDNPLQLVGGAINLNNRILNTQKAVINRDLASYSLHHTEIPYKTVSAGDSVTAAAGEWRCRLSITRPVLSPDFDPNIYSKTIGYACLKQGKVSDFTGLTVGTIDLSGINAPAEVKTMIQAAFKHGVYL